MAENASDVVMDLDFEPLSGSFAATLRLESRMKLTRAEHNAVRDDAVAAGGMGNTAAAYAAIKSALDGIKAGAGAWLDWATTGPTNADTTKIRNGVVWQFVARAGIPTPPQP